MELEGREKRDFERRLSAACLPARHDLEQFDFNYSCGITKPQMKELHLLHIRLAILGKILFIYQDVHYLSHDVIAFCRLVDFLFYTTFQGHGEVCKDGSVDILCLLNVPTCLLHFVRIVLGRYDAYEICCHHGLLCSKCYGEVGAVVQVLRSGMCAHGNHNLLCVPLTAPSRVGYRLPLSRLGIIQTSLASALAQLYF